MILAGIDEAGLGPLLGPMTVGCTVWSVPDGDLDAPPCLWKILRKQLSKTKSKSGRKLQVNDSKKVYIAGLKELERGVLAMTSTLWPMPESADGLLQLAAPRSVEPIRDHRWYDPIEGERFPLENDPTSLRLTANALKHEMAAAEVSLLGIWGSVLPELQYNRLVNATRNKGTVVFMKTAEHIDRVIREHPQELTMIACDRQSGRSRYADLLRPIFEGWDLTIHAEGDVLCDYRFARDSRRVRVTFREMAESTSLPVAAASMLAKYLRELLMNRYNAYWAARVPGLAPTAGYYSDGVRFLADTRTARIEMGLSDNQIERAR